MLSPVLSVAKEQPRNGEASLRIGCLYRFLARLGMKSCLIMTKGRQRYCPIFCVNRFFQHLQCNSLTKLNHQVIIVLDQFLIGIVQLSDALANVRYNTFITDASWGSTCWLTSTLPKGIMIADFLGFACFSFY